MLYFRCCLLLFSLTLPAFSASCSFVSFSCVYFSIHKCGLALTFIFSFFFPPWLLREQITSKVQLKNSVRLTKIVNCDSSLSDLIRYAKVVNQCQQGVAVFVCFPSVNYLAPFLFFSICRFVSQNETV